MNLDDRVVATANPRFHRSLPMRKYEVAPREGGFKVRRKILRQLLKKLTQLRWP
jgi:hypothetical protein